MTWIVLVILAGVAVLFGYLAVRLGRPAGHGTNAAPGDR
jgi:hypothetical protein